MKITIPWVVLAAALCLTGAGCSGKQASAPGPAAAGGMTYQTGENSPDGKGKITIGFSAATATFILERWNKDVRIFSGAAQELGADVLIQMSAGGTREQITQINYIANQNIDILVVITNDSEAIAGAIKQVRDAGVPVIAYDRIILGTPIDAFVTFDSKDVGRQYGQALMRAVPRGVYLIVNGSVHDQNSFDISAGLHDIIDPAIHSGRISVEREIWLEEWSFDEALETIGAIFEETTDFDAIVCGNDNIANAAIQLLSERRLAGEVTVIGQDAELISCQRLVEGTQLMTVYKPIGNLAARAARVAMAMAEGQSLPYDALVDNGSGTPVPTYIEKSIAIYKDNIDVVIRDGFHSYEDIYRNILE
jgi:D-xylose transport system substrate-binding protein